MARREEDEEEDEFEALRRRRRRYDPFSDSFDADFERMRRYMDEVMKAAMEGRLDERSMNKPFIYGWSMRMGPDGKPQIREFGNTPRGCTDETCRVGGGERERPVSIGGREPLTDVIETEKHVAVTVELPGVEKDDIAVDATEDMLTIRVDTAERRYFKEVDLPCEVKPDSAKASYKNGVLDVTLEKVKPTEKKGKRIVVD